MAKRRLAAGPWTNELSPRAEDDGDLRSVLAHSLDREIVHSSGGRDRGRGGRALGRRHHVRPRTVVSRGGGFAFLRVGDAGVEHVHQGKTETLGDGLQLAQGKVALVQLVIGQALVDQVVHELLDLLRGRLFERARSAFHHVSQTDDGALTRLRFRSAVTETFLRHFRDVFLAHLHDLAASPGVLVLLQGALVEVDRQAKCRDAAG